MNGARIAVVIMAWLGVAAFGVAQIPGLSWMTIGVDEGPDVLEAYPWGDRASEDVDPDQPTETWFAVGSKDVQPDGKGLLIVALILMLAGGAAALTGALLATLLPGRISGIVLVAGGVLAGGMLLFFFLGMAQLTDWMGQETGADIKTTADVGLFVGAGGIALVLAAAVVRLAIRPAAKTAAWTPSEPVPAPSSPAWAEPEWAAASPPNRPAPADEAMRPMPPAGPTGPTPPGRPTRPAPPGGPTRPAPAGGRPPASGPAAAPGPRMRNIRCPRCQTLNQVPAGQKPICKSCGYGK